MQQLLVHSGLAHLRIRQRRSDQLCGGRERRQLIAVWHQLAACDHLRQSPALLGIVIAVLKQLVFRPVRHDCIGVHVVLAQHAVDDAFGRVFLRIARDLSKHSAGDLARFDSVKLLDENGLRVDEQHLARVEAQAERARLLQRDEVNDEYHLRQMLAIDFYRVHRHFQSKQFALFGKEVPIGKHDAAPIEALQQRCVGARLIDVLIGHQRTPSEDLGARHGRPRTEHNIKLTARRIGQPYLESGAGVSARPR